MSVVDEILTHHGVKGMKWGVRRSREGSSRAGASADATRAASSRSQARKSGTKSLSNKELQDLVTRMNLEQQFSSLRGKSSVMSRGQTYAKSLIALGVTVNAAIAFAKSPAGQALRSRLGG